MFVFSNHPKLHDSILLVNYIILIGRWENSRIIFYGKWFNGLKQGPPPLRRSGGDHWRLKLTQSDTIWAGSVGILIGSQNRFEQLCLLICRHFDREWLYKVLCLSYEVGIGLAWYACVYMVKTNAIQYPLPHSVVSPFVS